MVYGVILLLAGVAYWLLQHTILLQEGAGSTLAAALGRDWKGRISLLIYGIAIPLAFLRPWIAGALYGFGVLPWLVPDRRIEREVSICVGDRPTRRTLPVRCLRSRYRLQVDARLRVSSDGSLVAEIAGETDRPCVHPMLPES
jgi:hypothetical protein